MENNTNLVGISDSNASAQAGATQPITVVLDSKEVAEIIVATLQSIKIYVVESEITEAQGRVKAVVEQTSF